MHHDMMRAAHGSSNNDKQEGLHSLHGTESVIYIKDAKVEIALLTDALCKAASKERAPQNPFRKEGRNGVPFDRYSD